VEKINEVEELSVVKAPRADEVIVGPGEVARAVDSVTLLEEEALLVTTLLAVDVLGKTSDSALIVDDEPDMEETPTTVDVEGRI
jgi:hypothetical protein